MTDWKLRHMNAFNEPKGDEIPIVGMIKGWVTYQEYHRRFESEIGNDGFLGPAWIEIGKGIRDLLNGELGRLDAGTLDNILVTNMTEQGYDLDVDEWKDK